MLSFRSFPQSLYVLPFPASKDSLSRLAQKADSLKILKLKSFPHVRSPGSSLTIKAFSWILGYSNNLQSSGEYSPDTENLNPKNFMSRILEASGSKGITCNNIG